LYIFRRFQEVGENTDRAAGWPFSLIGAEDVYAGTEIGLFCRRENSTEALKHFRKPKKTCRPGIIWKPELIVEKRVINSTTSRIRI
jgi:hypothetical protein